MTTYTAAKSEGFADWHVFHEDGHSVANYGKGDEAGRLARADAFRRTGGLPAQLRASLAMDDDPSPALRLRRGHRVCQTA